MALRTRKTKSLKDRFWPKVSKTAGCWLWVGSRQYNGYGYLYRAGDNGVGRKPIIG